jgi:peptidoglycan/xylan/chitin deacetylase (PgdA/CDA1 family)
MRSKNTGKSGGLAVLSAAAQYLGVNAALRSIGSKRLLVLNYHSVVPDECMNDPLAYGNSIGVSNFERQVAELARVFHPIAAVDLDKWLDDGGSIPRKSVLVTLDDGYRNNLTEAAPILRRLGVPGLINVSTGYIGASRMLWPDEVYWRILSWPDRMLPMPGRTDDMSAPRDRLHRRVLAARIRESCKRIRHCDLSQYLARLRTVEIPAPRSEIAAFMSWDEVRALSRQGFDIGSHTVNHPILTEVDPDGLETELTESKRVIERELGMPCPYFAYPNGGPFDVSDRVIEAVRRAGYRFAFTVTGRLAVQGQSPYAIDRVYIPGQASMPDFHTRSSGLRAFVKNALPW